MRLVGCLQIVVIAPIKVRTTLIANISFKNSFLLSPIQIFCHTILKHHHILIRDTHILLMPI